MDERLTDGTRIAQLLASELDGLGDAFAAVDVVDANPGVEPTPDGAFAYRVARGSTTLAEVFVHPDRTRVEFRHALDAAAAAADAAGLRVRPKAVRPPRTLVFVEDGAEVKRVLDAFAAVVDSVATESDDSG